MAQHRYGQRIEGVQRAPCHLEKSDLDGGGQAMGVPIAQENGLSLRGSEGEKVSDFECSEFRRKRLKSKERQLPVLHDAPLTQRIKRLGVRGSG
jgi:hypothetical protein